MSYCMEPRTRKGYGFLSFTRNFSKKYRKELLDTRLDALKTASKKLIHEAAKATYNFIGNKIAGKIVKTRLVIDEYLWNIKKRENKY